MSKKSKKDKKSKKPQAGATAPPKEVKAPEKKKQVKVTPPPLALPSIDGVVNPLFQGTRFKRALAVALAHCTDDDEVLCQSMRESGIVANKGLNGGKLDTGNLKQSELSGRGYALRTGRKYQNSYPKEKYEPCMEFAKKLIALIKAGKVDEARAKANADWEAGKADWVKAQEEKAAKKAEKKAKKAEAGDEAEKPKKGKKSKKDKKAKKEEAKKEAEATA